MSFLFTREIAQFPEYLIAPALTGNDYEAKNVHFKHRESLLQLRNIQNLSSFIKCSPYNEKSLVVQAMN